MKKTINFQKGLLIFGVTLLLIGLLIFITKLSVFTTNADYLATAITFDLLLTIPLIYFLLIRKTTIPKTTVVAFVVIGIVVCSLILPSENQFYLGLFKTWILPIIELSVLAYVGYNLIKAVKSYKARKHLSFDFFTTLKDTCYEILPKSIVIPIVTEIAVFYYGFIHWKKIKLKENEFSYHKNSGTVSLLVAIIFIIAIETVVLHILLNKWSNIVAWILSFISIYSAIQLFGFLKSISKRPILIENTKIVLRYGIMRESIIDLNTIDTIELFTKDIELNKETRKLSFLGDLEGHNVIIRLKEEQTLIGLYGIKRPFKILALHVDDKLEFINQVKNRLDEYSRK